jgi:DNA-binding transcriptional LysR family regulator
MDITSLLYFQELAKNLHITNTANKLHISQQTLSNHIKRLEDYYGTELFHRKPSLSLTYSGEYMLAFSRIVLKEETNLKDIISDIEDSDKGVIRFGASIARGIVSLPEIIPRFNTRYPNVEIRYIDSLSLNLESQVESGDLDFAIVLKGDSNPNLIEHHIFKDQVYLCVPDSLLIKHYGEETNAIKERSFEGAHLNDFARLPFSMFSNRLGKAIRYCFEAANCEPNVHFTTSFSLLQVPLCSQGIVACFMTRMNLSGTLRQFDGKVNIFPLYCNDKPMIQDISIIYHKNRYLPHYAKHFLDILFCYFEDLMNISVKQGQVIDKSKNTSSV